LADPGTTLRVELEIVGFLRDHFRIKPDAVDRLRVIHRWSHVLAAYATTTPGSSTPFREIGRKQPIREITSLSKLGRRPAVLNNLHGTTIDLLAEIGWTRTRLADDPSSAKHVVERARAVALGRDTFKADGRPRNYLARSVAIIAATIYEEVTDKRPTWTDDAVGFVAFLAALGDNLPSLKLGSVEGLARRTLIELRARETAQVTSISSR